MLGGSGKILMLGNKLRVRKKGRGGGGGRREEKNENLEEAVVVLCTFSNKTGTPPG